MVSRDGRGPAHRERRAYRDEQLPGFYAHRELLASGGGCSSAWAYSMDSARTSFHRHENRRGYCGAAKTRPLALRHAHFHFHSHSAPRVVRGARWRTRTCAHNGLASSVPSRRARDAPEIEPPASHSGSGFRAPAHLSPHTRRIPAHFHFHSHPTSRVREVRWRTRTRAHNGLSLSVPSRRARGA